MRTCNLILIFLLASCGLQSPKGQVNPTVGPKNTTNVRVTFSCDGKPFPPLNQSIAADPQWQGVEEVSETNTYVDPTGAVRTYCRDDYERVFAVHFSRDPASQTKTWSLGISQIGGAPYVVCTSNMPLVPKAGDEYQCSGVYDSIYLKAVLNF